MTKTTIFNPETFVQLYKEVPAENIFGALKSMAIERCGNDLNAVAALVGHNMLDDSTMVDKKALGFWLTGLAKAIEAYLNKGRADIFEDMKFDADQGQPADDEIEFDVQKKVVPERKPVPESEAEPATAVKPAMPSNLPVGWEDTLLSEMHRMLPKPLKVVSFAAMKAALPDDWKDSLLAAIGSGVGTLIVSTDVDAPREKVFKFPLIWARLLNAVLNAMNPHVKTFALNGLNRISEEEWKLVKFNTSIIFITNMLIRSRGHRQDEEDIVWQPDELGAKSKSSDSVREN